MNLAFRRSGLMHSGPDAGNKEVKPITASKKMKRSDREDAKN